MFVSNNLNPADMCAGAATGTTHKILFEYGTSNAVLHTERTLLWMREKMNAKQGDEPKNEIRAKTIV